MLVPVVGIVQVGMQAHSDRYTYLPEIGLAIMLTWAGADLAEKLRFPRWAPGAVSACVIAILMILAYNQASYWHDSELLWTHAIACTENNYIAHNNLGNVLMRRGDFNDAIAQYEMALGTKPDFAEAQNNLGNVLSKEGALDEAIPHYEKALLIKPDYADAHYNFGNVLSKKGEWADAITQFETALKIKPDSAESHQGLGIAYRHTGRADEAVAQYKAALELKPDFAEAQSNLAYLLATCPDARLRNGSMAVGLAERANLLTGGNNPVVLGTLAAAYAEAGRFPDAIGAVSQAIQFAEAQGNRALDSTLEGHLKLYESGKPLRDN
jgi:tetratricopeptide (TPR) repeat protein